MRGSRRWFGVLVAASSLGAALPAWAEAPKNVIILIGDGMGFEQTRMSRYYFNGINSPYAFETLPNFAVMTHDNSLGATTDSAASATAIATGYKVDNGVVSVAKATGSDPRTVSPTDGRNLTTLLETFKLQGKSTGLVTTDVMTGATPACFGAHDTSRNNTAAIATDYLNDSRPNVLFGGPATGFSSATAAAAGYSVATNSATLATVSGSQVAGVFGSGVFPYDVDGGTFYATNPRLSEMTSRALDLLSTNSNGFFLMVENALIDKGAGSRSRVSHEVQQFSLAVDQALAFAASRTDTLVLVLADHETGSFRFSDFPAIGVYPDNTSPDFSFGTNHSSSPVAVYAMGPNARLVNGKIDNTDIVRIATATAQEPLVKSFRQGQGGYASAHDTQIRGDQGTTGQNFGSAATLNVDLEDVGAQVQSLISFDGLFSAGGIPAGATIKSATLTVHTGSVSGDTTPGKIYIYRMQRPWSESTKWDDLLNGVDGSDILAVADDLEPAQFYAGMVTFDVTASVAAWLAGAQNYGWALIANGTDGWWFHSSDQIDTSLRPLLTVAYEVPEPASLTVLMLAGGALLLRRRARA